MKKLILRNRPPQPADKYFPDLMAKFGNIYLSWKVQAPDGEEWCESPHWGLIREDEIEKATKELRDKGHEFEVEDLRESSL